MKRLQHVLAVLSDGRFHSGEHLAVALSVSRSAIWKICQKLDALGLPIERVRGRGYRLPHGMILLSAETINAHLMTHGMYLKQCCVFPTLSSTNAYCLNYARTKQPAPMLCLAEHQTNGRGRRGRQWLSPLGYNIYASLYVCLDRPLGALAGLSVAVGLGCVQTLHALGILGARLKWPNDIFIDGRKVAGILVEMLGEPDGPCDVVIGVGLNVRCQTEQFVSLDKPWTDLETYLGTTKLDRNRLAAQLVLAMNEKIASFLLGGLANLQACLRDNDYLLGKCVQITGHNTCQQGIARGIDNEGRLIVATAHGIVHLYSGEVSVCDQIGVSLY